MKISADQLLRQLASSGSLAGLGAASQSPAATTLEQSSFADLLNQARDGTLLTKQPVTVQPGAGISLTSDQLARVSLAADQAEASGVRNALVMMDGQQFVLDVRARQIVGAPQGKPGITAGVDGVINLGNSGASAQTGTAPAAQPAGAIAPPQAVPGQNASLARLLQTLQGN